MPEILTIILISAIEYGKAKAVTTTGAESCRTIRLILYVGEALNVLAGLFVLSGCLDRYAISRALAHQIGPLEIVAHGLTVLKTQAHKALSSTTQTKQPSA